MIPVLVNRDGGTAAALGDELQPAVEAAFAAADIEIELHILRGGEMRAAVEALKGHPLVVVGGGDGTLGCAAACFADSDTTLGILPLGTRNHLARELGVPLDLPGAARLFVDYPTRAIDLARANGRVFVNNASDRAVPLAGPCSAMPSASVIRSPNGSPRCPPAMPR